MQKGDGAIPAGEIGLLMRSLGLSPSEAQIAEFSSEVSQKGGSCNLETFLEFCARKGRDNENLQDLLEFFVPFDPGVSYSCSLHCNLKTIVATSSLQCYDVQIA